MEYNNINQYYKTEGNHYNKKIINIILSKKKF